MILKIFEDTKQEVEEQEVYLKLQKTESGDRIAVVACEKNGEKHIDGLLISFTPDGKIWRAFNINKGLGFELNDRGQIKEED